MKVVMHIDRLCLHGVPVNEQRALVRDLTRTLQARLAQPDAAEQLAELGHREQRRAPLAPTKSSLGVRAGDALMQALQR